MPSLRVTEIIVDGLRAHAVCLKSANTPGDEFLLQIEGRSAFQKARINRINKRLVK